MTNMSHEHREPVVTIFVATINTAHATELCIRSLDRYTSLAHRTTVGDCGSTDRTLPMLMRQLRANRVQDVELAPCGRDHGSWIDHWIETCQTDYAAIVDSDVEILDGAWLETLIETATRTRATCVAAELLPERENYVDAYGYNRRLSRRPSPWMMLLNVPEARNMPSFKFTWREDQSVPEGARSYDTGAKFLEGVEAAGLLALEAPAVFKSHFRHYGGLSWTKGLRVKHDWKLRGLQLKVAARRVRVWWRLLWMYRIRKD